MKHFTIDSTNIITVHASRRAAKETGNPAFSNEVQFADAIGPDNKRLVEIWNSLPGIKAVTKFANRKAATARIWGAIQQLGAPAVEPGLEHSAQRPVVDSTWRLVQHSHQRQWRCMEEHRWPQKRGRDTVEHHQLGACLAHAFKDGGRIDHCQRKGPIGEGNEVHTRHVLRCELGQTPVKQIATRQSTRIAECYEGG